MSNIADILSYLIGKVLTCRLCLRTIDGKIVHLEDELVLKFDQNDNITTILDVLHSIFPNEVTSELEKTDVICQKCIKSSINCYNFFQTCQRSNESLHKVLDTITIPVTKIDDTYFKTVYMCVRRVAECEIVYDTKRIPQNPAIILKRINFIENQAKEKLKSVKPNKYICDVCEKFFIKKHHMKMHFFRMHAPKHIKCKQCTRYFGSEALLKEHVTLCHTNLICSECGRDFKNYITFKKHETSHRVQLSCPKCGRHYKNRESFLKHIKFGLCHVKRKCITDADIKELYTCDICQKSYVRKGSLLVHMKYEHGDGKAFICEWCNKKFTSNSRLKYHIVKHTKEKNFICDVCNNKFVTKESLLYHTRLHTGEKPFSCRFCDEKFLSSSRRMIHMRWKHLEPDFQCDVCLKKFKTKAYLKKHFSRHARTNSKII